MPHRDLVVIGASAGGVDALMRLAAQLPPDLDAAVLVVLHMPPYADSHLADRLNAAGELPAAAAVDGEPILPKRIYVAVPDRHLMVEGRRIRLSRGPRESRSRPSIDVLFRSAAFSSGPRVIGVVLTGMLDDGTAGLWAIKDRGGMAIVQSPEEAEYPSMPLSAAQHVAVDYTVTLAELPALLKSLTREELSLLEGSMTSRNLEIENRIALGDNGLESNVRSLGAPSFYTCPECHGSMVRIEEGSGKRFRCHTGHGFTAAALAEGSLPEIEQVLWSALAQLEEREMLLAELEQTAVAEGNGQGAAQIAAQARAARRIATQVRQLVQDPMFKDPPQPSIVPADRSGG
jgi:two-component system, chemotaxis family, protein-glutamate methylesterase/glutaminase